MFWLFFLLHIVFAALNFWNLFNLVAIAIFFFSHFHTLMTLYFSNLDEVLTKLNLIKISTFFSIIYSIGYWYAVNDMNFEIWLFLTGLVPLFISFLSYRVIIADN
ncbi:MAG: hypothetical protein CMA27_04505 [Euryarchaeota archaeon]|nr:hypothetical protein [Euryarchaeota archaeon]|tara:strand:- start:5855 stop:6169 length:315 start_codon:yes stop_codon:yes gene_type:complete